MYFLNENTGWAVETWFTGKVLKTTNKGADWVAISALQFHDGTGISFYDELKGWISASSGFLYRTTNGGYNWILSNCNSCSNVDDFNDIQFINQTTGWAYGDAHIFKSTDGGLNYFILNCPCDVKNGFFIDSLNGWVGAYMYSAKSTDGGNSWFQLSSINSQAQGIYFVNLNTGWISTFSGSILRTTNSGENWSEQYNNQMKLNKIHFVNENTGWVVGDSGSIIKTTNTGVNWYKQNSPIVGELYGIFMISPTEGWVCGERYILHTTNGGEPIGIQPISSEIPDGFSLSQNYPNPFNPVTKINFDIPSKVKSEKSKAPLSFGEGQGVRLIIYDALGREIETLVNEELNPGSYEIEFDGTNYTSGIYFYKLIAEGFSQTKKMVLIK